jgi:hypothetical protein
LHWFGAPRCSHDFSDHRSQALDRLPEDRLPEDVSLGYSLLALPSSEGAAQVNAMYAFSRSLALAVVASVVLCTHSSLWLRAIALAMILVQAGDAVIGSRIRDRLKTLAPGLTAVANLIALLYFLR